jgi:hypothetical protein
MAMFRFYADNDFKNPVSVSRSKVMKNSKIKSIATYHKCLKDLIGWGYIKYQPSYHPAKGSLVYLNEILEKVVDGSK